MMMTGFSAIPSNALHSAMPRKASVDEAEAVEEKEDAKEPITTNSTSVNTPPATGKNVVTPVLAGAGGALAGGIPAGLGYWHFAPNATTMSEADALAKVTGDSALKAIADKELDSLKKINAQSFADKLVDFTISANTIIQMLGPNGDIYQGKLSNQPTLIRDGIKKFFEESPSAEDILQKKQLIIDAYLNPLNTYEQVINATDNNEVLKNSVKSQKSKIQDVLKSLEAYDKLDLKDTDTVKKLTKDSLKTATQKVEGFMKWGYAKAEDLEKIGGKELVEHANSSKIALGAGALVAGAGVGTLAYFLLNKPKKTPQTDS